MFYWSVNRKAFRVKIKAINYAKADFQIDTETLLAENSSNQNQFEKPDEGKRGLKNFKYYVIKLIT